MTVQKEYKYLKSDLKEKKEFLTVLIEYLFKSERLSEREYWISRYSLLSGSSVENICDKLNIEKSTYHSVRNTAYAKVDISYRYYINHLTEKIRLKMSEL